MAFGSAKGRFSVAAILSGCVALEPVEEGNEPIRRVEGGLCRFLDHAPGLGRGGHLQRHRGSRRARPRGEGMDVAHGLEALRVGLSCGRRTLSRAAIEQGSHLTDDAVRVPKIGGGKGRLRRDAFKRLRRGFCEWAE